MEVGVEAAVLLVENLIVGCKRRWWRRRIAGEREEMQGGMKREEREGSLRVSAPIAEDFGGSFSWMRNEVGLNVRSFPGELTQILTHIYDRCTSE